MPIEQGGAGFLEYSEEGGNFKLSVAREGAEFSFEASYSDNLLSLELSGKGDMKLSALYSAGKSEEKPIYFLKGEYCPGNLGYSPWVFPFLVETVPAFLGQQRDYFDSILNSARRGISENSDYSRAEDFLLELENSPE